MLLRERHLTELERPRLSLTPEGLTLCTAVYYRYSLTAPRRATSSSTSRWVITTATQHSLFSPCVFWTATRTDCFVRLLPVRITNQYTSKNRKNQRLRGTYNAGNAHTPMQQIYSAMYYISRIYRSMYYTALLSCQTKHGSTTILMNCFPSSFFASAAMSEGMCAVNCWNDLELLRRVVGC